MPHIRRFKVIGDKLVPLKYDSFNSGSKGYYTAVFTFGKDWEGLIPHITISENGVKRADEVIVNNTFKISVAESGTMRVGVYGIDAEGKKCISSNEVLFDVSKGAYDGAPALPSDIWEGYRITVLGYVERAEAAVRSVKNFTVSAVSGSEAKVEKTETDTGIHYEFTLPQGEKGIPGEKGEPGKDGLNGKDGKDGVDGKNGVDGKDGYTPQKNIDYFDGKDGQDGKNGEDGYSPIRGTDYWTPEDIAEIKSYVDEAILGGAW